MLETFKVQLTAKAKALGVNLSKTRIDAIADRLHKKFPDLTAEAVTDHDARIDDLNELQPFSDLAKADDQIRTLSAKTKGQPPKPEDQPAPDSSNPEKPDKDETPAWAKSLIAEVQTLKAEKVQGTMKTKAKDLLKEIPEQFWDGRTLPEKDDDLPAFVETVTASYTTFKQDLVNKGLMTATPPTGGDAGKMGDKAFEASIDAFVAEKKGVPTSTQVKI